jgi:bifunctional non-homologous end joining protein LigD
MAARATRRKGGYVTRPGRAPAAVRGSVDGAVRRPLPRTVDVELALLVKQVPEGEGWVHEQKFDGYRMLCFVRGGAARLVSRNGKDWSAAFETIVGAAAQLPVESALLDGEVVALDEQGRSSFQKLQNALSEVGKGLIYYAFDLLHLDGWDLRGATLLDRKRLLARLKGVRHGARGLLRYSDHIQGSGVAFFREACRRELEGVISKRQVSRYTGTRSGAWTKTKCTRRQEFVIGGFTEPQRSREGLGALLLGVREGKELRYAGRVGTGFTDKLLVELARRLRKIEQPRSPFAGKVPGRDVVHWVRPELVAEVEFTEWTREGLLRHPSFKGLREDKRASEVVREKPAPTPKAARPSRVSPSKAVRPSRAPASKSIRSGRAAAENVVAGVTISSPDRVIDAESGVTKIQLARTLDALADWMLPHLADRPLMVVRCPGGVGGACFHQKHRTDGMSPAIRAVQAQETRGAQGELVIRDRAGLIGLVQMGVIEFHTWGARADRPGLPDRLVFDLDPDPSVGWPKVVEAAVAMRRRLAGLGLVSFARTTGGKGLHVVVPIERRTGWPEAKEFCRQIATGFALEDPGHFTATLSKAARRGRIFIDYLRNARGATAVASYSPRARAGLPIAVPVSWSELRTLRSGSAYTVANIARRLRSLRDPWAELPEVRQSLPAPSKRGEPKAAGKARPRGRAAAK